MSVSLALTSVSQRYNVTNTDATLYNYAFGAHRLDFNGMERVNANYIYMIV